MIILAIAIWLALGLIAWAEAAYRFRLKLFGQDWPWWILLPGFLWAGPFAFLATRERAR